MKIHSARNQPAVQKTVKTKRTKGDEVKIDRSEDVFNPDHKKDKTSINLRKAGEAIFSSKRTYLHYNGNLQRMMIFFTPAVLPDGKKIFACDGYKLYCIDRNGKLQ